MNDIALPKCRLQGDDNISMLQHDGSISLLGCKRHKTNNSRNNMIITNDLNIDCKGINKLLFTLNETNDKFDWRCENQWYNDDTEVIKSDIIIYSYATH